MICVYNQCEVNIEDCFLHHVPDAGYLDPSVREIRFENTMRRLKELFGGFVQDQVWDEESDFTYSLQICGFEGV